MTIDWDKLVLGPCHNAFSVVGNYVTVDNVAFDINVIFDKAYTRIVVIQGEPVTETMPACGIRLSEFPSPSIPAQSDHITVVGNQYIVREVQLDGLGAAKLLLNGPLS